MQRPLLIAQQKIIFERFYFEVKLLHTFGVDRFRAHFDGAELKDLDQDEWCEGHALALSGAFDSLAERSGNGCGELRLICEL
jgi:hypothetical protein